MKTWIIEVTQADIDTTNEQRRQVGGISTGYCPVACALRRLFPAAGYIYAHPDHLSVSEPEAICNALFYARSTAAIRRFMRRWDRTWQATPTRFRLEER